LLQRFAAVDELRLAGEISGQGPIPDLFRFVTADLVGHQIPSAIENAAVAMDPSLIFIGVEILAHLDRQRTHDIGVVRLGHIAQAVAGARSHDVFAHQPIAAIDHDAEKVGHGFVHGAGLILIDEVGGVLGDPVG